MSETVISVGIDVGTSTTELVFSRLTIENVAGAFVVPRISIVDKTVIYRSRIYLTPLINPELIDVDALRTSSRTIPRGRGETIRRAYRCCDHHPVRPPAPTTPSRSCRRSTNSPVTSLSPPPAAARRGGAGGPRGRHRFVVTGQSPGHRQSRRRWRDDQHCGLPVRPAARGVLPGYRRTPGAGRQWQDQLHLASDPPARRGIRIPLEVGDRADLERLRTLARVMARQLAMGVGLISRDEMHSTMYTNMGRPLGSRSSRRRSASPVAWPI